MTSTTAPAYTPMSPSDLDTVHRMISLAFGSPVDGVRDWLVKSGHENMRTYRDSASDSVPAANLMRIPMGHFFGGKSVPCIGIAAVAVAPESRGTGVATRMMQECVREIHREKIALSSLYPAVVSLYQRAGYERTGYHFLYSLPINRVVVPRSRLKVRAFTPDDLPALQACYTDMARSHDGYLDRGPYVWDRVQNWRGAAYSGLVVEGPSGSIDGYIFFNQDRVEEFNGRQLIKISDMGARHPDAARRILQLMAEYQSIAEEINFTGGPAHHFITLLPEHRFTVKLKDYWMLRITHGAEALKARGYPAISADLAIDLRDDQIPDNAGRYTLRLKEGRPEVTHDRAPSSGGPAPSASSSSFPTISLDACAFAALYTGFQTPSQLRYLGRLTGDDRACSIAQALFSGSTPSLVDFY